MPRGWGRIDLDQASVAAESLSSEVASLDATGTIVWANAAWLLAARRETRELLAGCTVGVDFLRTSRASGTAIAQVVANGVAAVIAGERGRFEQELISVDGSRRWKLRSTDALKRAQGEPPCR